MKSKTPWMGVLVVFIVFSVVALQSCTTTPPPIVEQQSNTEQTKKQSKRSTNPILCVILFLSLDCYDKEQDKAKVYEAETHPVPVEDPVLELLIDIGEVEPDASN